MRWGELGVGRVGSVVGTCLRRTVAAPYSPVMGWGKCVLVGV